MRGVYITLERQNKHGGTKGCTACFGQAKASGMHGTIRGYCGQCSCTAPENVNVGAAESSAAQPTRSAVRTLETEDDGSAKRQRLADMPILHETDVDVNVDAHKMVVLAEMPDDQGQLTQRIIDWDKEYYGAKSGTLLDTQKVYEGRLRELANTDKLEVAEAIQLQKARAQSLEIVSGKWLDDAKETPEDLDAVRSRLVATQVNTYFREDVTQATSPIKASSIIVSQAVSKTNAKGQHDCLIGRHAIRVAFFHAKESGRVVIIPPKGLAPPGVGWRCVKAWYGTRVTSKCLGNEVADTSIKEGCKPVVVVATMFVSENHRYVTACHGDDFVSDSLTTHFNTKILPRIGPTAYGGEVTEGKHPSRTI